MCEDIENVTTRSIMPIVAAVRSSVTRKSHSPTISNKEDATFRDGDITNDHLSEINHADSRPSPLRKLLCQNLNKVGAHNVPITQRDSSENPNNTAEETPTPQTIRRTLELHSF